MTSKLNDPLIVAPEDIDPGHDWSRALRSPGSIGPGTDPSRVIKGRKMSGQMGNTKRTAMNRTVERIDAEKNLLLVRGSVPGSIDNYVVIRAG